MAVNYYDDTIVEKIKKWLPTNRGIRVLGTDDTKRFFETQADDTADKQAQLPMFTLSRSNDIELQLNIKNSKSFDGIVLFQDESKTIQWNAIPIKLDYQLDIFTKTQSEGTEWVRQLLFKLINNPAIVVEFMYNGVTVEHIAYIRVQPTISDSSDISQRLFPGQFYRWTIQFEIHDAFLFNIPIKTTWKLGGVTTEVLSTDGKLVETDQYEFN